MLICASVSASSLRSCSRRRARCRRARPSGTRSSGSCWLSRDWKMLISPAPFNSTSSNPASTRAVSARSARGSATQPRARGRWRRRRRRFACRLNDDVRVLLDDRRFLADEPLRRRRALLLDRRLLERLDRGVPAAGRARSHRARRDRLPSDRRSHGFDAAPRAARARRRGAPRPPAALAAAAGPRSTGRRCRRRFDAAARRSLRAAR